jgi:hypothetical protein
MDTLEYYKLKDELSTLIKTEVASSINNERDLQQKYIGIGLKVAAGGIAAAVLAVGLFGVKSAYDVQSRISEIPTKINERADKEIIARFNKDNPVVKYDAILLDTSARAIASSIAVQAEGRPFTLDNRLSDLFLRALNDPNIPTGTKLSIVDALSTSKIRFILPAIDQAIITLAEKLSADNPVVRKIDT